MKRPFPTRPLLCSAMPIALAALLVRVALAQPWIPGCIVGALSLGLWTFDAARSWRAWWRAGK